jgi:hypothetical protein
MLLMVAMADWMVREKRNKAFRLHNFGIFFPKKSAKFEENIKNEQVEGDLRGVQGYDSANTRAEGVSGGEISNM